MIRRRTTLLATVSMVLVLGCESTPGLAGPEDAIGLSVAYGRWEPTEFDTCTKEVHDSYSVVGPDGKLYPTWHPPVDDATGCRFGHEHGRNPAGSNLFAEVGHIPFAYANEQLDLWDPNGKRHEDHVGHKIEWANDFRINQGGVAGALLDIRCDVLVKMHQGSHSKDAFTNNMHELVYHLRCNDGSGFSMTVMTAIGEPGEFVSTCTGQHIPVGVATPPNSPNHGGKRRIPDRSCIDQHVLVGPGGDSNFNSGLRESWELNAAIKTKNGRTLASVNPYFQVMNPSRFFDPAADAGVGRPVELCYEAQSDGRIARGEECEQSTANGSLTPVYSRPASFFDGARRFVDINAQRVSNSAGPELWYTDPFGRNGATQPFRGSVQQWVAQKDNTGLDFHGPVIGRDRYYGGRGVHAPN